MNNTPLLSDIYDRRQHPCGCETYFDLALWRSVAVVRCRNHRAKQATP